MKFSQNKITQKIKIKVVKSKSSEERCEKRQQNKIKIIIKHKRKKRQQGRNEKISNVTPSKICCFSHLRWGMNF